MEGRPLLRRDGLDITDRPEGQILVVDDEPFVRDTVSDILTAGRFSCQVACGAAEALCYLAAMQFDCLVTDVRMPGDDGVELMKRALAIDPDLEVILMTGMAESGPAIQALRAGASNYILKPFGVDEILHCVRRAVEHRRLILENREYQTNLEEKVQKQSKAIRNQFLSATQSLARAVDARDPYTRGHSERVGHLAWRVASHFFPSVEECGFVNLAGLLHDIGKIGVPDGILRKRGSLSPGEWDNIKTHPATGGDIVGKIDPPKVVIDGITSHHERWDGRGYPHGRAGEAIPLVGRVLAVADAYDAMASDRPYRCAYSPETAKNKLRDARNTQFDPAVVDVTLHVLENEMDEEPSGPNGPPQLRREDQASTA